MTKHFVEQTMGLVAATMVISDFDEASLEGFDDLGRLAEELTLGSVEAHGFTRPATDATTAAMAVTDTGFSTKRTVPISRAFSLSRPETWVLTTMA